MSNCIWLGSAVSVQQVRTYTVAGTPNAGDVFLLTVRPRRFHIPPEPADAPAAVAAGVAAMLQATSASLNPELAQLAIGYVAGNAFFTITGVAGIPFDIATALGSGNTGSGTFTWTDTVREADPTSPMPRPIGQGARSRSAATAST